MPYPFVLPTTSSVLFSDFFASPTHPSLPLTATSKRSVLKDTLKKHKRLASGSQAAHLSVIQDALNNYLPYLLALNTASGYRDVGSERLDVNIVKPLEVEWRSTLSASIPGREPPRPKLTGLHHELAFVLSTLGYTYTLQARAQLRALHDTTTQTTEQRTTAISTAMKHLLSAYSIHNHLASQPQSDPSNPPITSGPIDTQPSTLSALASLALAEATLVVVSKDDPYAAAIADDRNASNRDWMFRAPTIPKVRAHLYARICLAAAEHASQAHGLLARTPGGVGSKIDDDLVKYTHDLRQTSRAKATRFLAIDAELSGKTGEALAWLRGARGELGLPTADVEEGRRRGLKGLKHTFMEKREDRKIATNSREWGLDAGRLEEARVVEQLEAKWEKENSTINVQVVPPEGPLLAAMPSGREYHSPAAWVPPQLDEGTLAAMRAPPEPGQDRGFGGEEEDSGDEMGAGGYVPAGVGGTTPGAFPASAGELGRSGTASSYY
ncbi:hypothetical protein MBLNU230_g7252t1 [Neophaeotheca triangularis]